tara:strand:+ start:1682 stop:2545 length:864 start_codon:yes stop_codon:yes gene_type:complete
MDYTIEQTSPGCYRVDLGDGSDPDWHADFLLRSDAHHDNAHTDQRLEAIHLEEAEERDAGILDIGDLHCAMQGKYDRRASTDACRPEQQQGRYLDSLIDCAADFYEPFAHRWLLLAPGNHETSILKHHETDLTERLAERFRITGSPVVVGSYAGFIRFQVRRHGRAMSRVMYYTHGNGGGGPMTHGVLNTRRRQSFLPNADIVWSGHTHDSWTVRLAKTSLVGGCVRVEDVHHVSTPGYKDEFSPMSGWHIERGAPPKPVGAAWLRFTVDRSADDHRSLRVDLSEAR